MITVTEVKIYPFESSGAQKTLRAYAEITLNDSLVIKGIRVLQNANGGLYIGFPSQMGSENKYRDLIIPKSPELKKLLRDQIIKAYKEQINSNITEDGSF